MSIQLEKVSLRDEMLSLFVKKSQAARSVVPTAVSGASRTPVVVGCQRCSALVNFSYIAGGSADCQTRPHCRLC